MDATTRLRLLFGAVWPFVFGKVADAVRVRFATSMAKRSVPTIPQPTRRLRHGVMPLPSNDWLGHHGVEVVEFAQQARSGEWSAYDIPEWTVGEPDVEVTDVRSFHELSRMHHWCAYALAAHIDEENRDDWAELLQTEILTFIEKYPPHEGFHWEYPMGISLRCYSMLVAWDWISQSGFINSSAESVIAASAIDHATLVMARREHSGGMTTSHYLANLLGIMSAGTYVTSDSHAKEWYEFAVFECKNEMRKQFLADGLNFEASTGYHRQSTDIILQAVLLAKPNVHKVVDNLTGIEERSILSRAINAQKLLDKCGMPLIGDNDDGMAMKLQGLLANTSLMFDRAEHVLEFDELPQAPFKHYPFENFGLDIYQTKHIITTLRCGGIGQYGKGGHAHNDQNSITVRVNGKPFIIDSGSTYYTGRPRERNNDRSTQRHATAMVSGTEQNPWPKDENEGLFWMLRDATKGRVELRTQDEWKGALKYFNHVRHVMVRDAQLEVKDSMTSEEFKLYFPLHEQVTVTVNDMQVVLKNGSTSVVLEWDSGECRVLPTTRADRFAHSVSNKTIQLSVYGSEVHWTLRVVVNPKV